MVSLFRSDRVLLKLTPRINQTGVSAQSGYGGITHRTNQVDEEVIRAYCLDAEETVLGVVGQRYSLPLQLKSQATFLLLQQIVEGLAVESLLEMLVVRTRETLRPTMPWHKSWDRLQKGELDLECEIQRAATPYAGGAIAADIDRPNDYWTARSILTSFTNTSDCGCQANDDKCVTSQEA